MTDQVPPTAEPSGVAGPPSVLVVRAAERASELLALLRERGLDPVAAPVIERVPVEDPAQLDAARERLADGAYAWVAITSVNAVDALLGPTTDPAATAWDDTTGPVAQSGQGLPGATRSPVPSPAPDDTPASGAGLGTDLPALARWAAVGPATRRALAGHGAVATLVPETATAAGLAAAFPAAPAATGREPRVLLPLGDLASDALRAGLVAKGWAVDVVTAYRTVARELPRDLHRRFDAVVVASGSAARQVATQIGPQRVVAIGEPSARAAGDAGHTVLAVAESPTDEALADAVTEALARTGQESEQEAGAP